ncbi:MAG TPA: hypothetical protein VMB23_08205, partial [Spirochaetia bacterium]|nr:hypothetical protein [Spirochaetia bacterium]
MVCPQARLGWRSVVWGGLFLLLFGTVHLTAAPAKKVLLFHADNQFQPANLVMDSTFRSRLTGAPDLAVELYSEYLEAVRFPSPQTTALAVSLLKAKYRTVNLDLILVTDDTSWDFFSRVRQDLFPGIPVVFCGITEGKIGPKDLPPGTTGNFKNVDIGANLKAIQTLQPEVDRVLVVLGVSPQDQYYEKLARKAFAGVSHPAAVFLNGESIEEIGAATATPSPKTVALYISLYQDGMGKTFNPRDALDRLVAGSRIPVYGVSSTYLGHGIVGGNLLSFEDVSADASSMVLQILRGQDPGTIPPRTSENRSYFDWPQLVRWGIKGSLIPPGSVVLNRPPDPWVVYRWQILGTAAFLAFETALLVLLVSLL